MTAKYIIIEDDNTGMERAVLFSQLFDHYQFANLADKTYGKIVAGGFVRIEALEVTMVVIERQLQPVVVCYGESHSLNVKSRPQDGAIIQRSFRD